MNTATMERPPLVKIVGTVANIVLAEATNKPGKIELTSGKVLRAFADKLQQVKKGDTYDFGCEPNEFRGVLNHTVRAVRAAQATPEPQRAMPAQAQREPTRQSAPIEPPRQPPTQPNGNGHYRPTHPRDAERMFVCSTLNAYIQTGRVECVEDELIARVNTLRNVWQATFGGDATD
jgi:hypothetical protein